MEIKKICVLGAGLMGNGIAQVCAQAGYEVALRDIEQRFVDGGIEHDPENSFPRRRKRTNFSQQMNAILDRLHPPGHQGSRRRRGRRSSRS